MINFEDIDADAFKLEVIRHLRRNGMVKLDLKRAIADLLEGKRVERIKLNNKKPKPWKSRNLVYGYRKCVISTLKGEYTFRELEELMFELTSIGYTGDFEGKDIVKAADYITSWKFDFTLPKPGETAHDLKNFLRSPKKCK